MILLQKPRRVYVFPSLRTVKPKPFNHTQPSNLQKSLYLLPVCPFTVLLLFCSLTALTPFLAEGAYKCKTNPERVSRRTPVGVCVATETPPGGVSPVLHWGNGSTRSLFRVLPPDTTRELFCSFCKKLKKSHHSWSWQMFKLEGSKNEHLIFFSKQ